MIPRYINAHLKELKQYFPIISLTGPRQSGKTTLLRGEFPAYRYVTFESPSVKAQFSQDPEGFLREYNDKVIFDEAQNVPSLFSYLQGMVDADRRPGRFILSGSQNFLLRKSITQSLAGRIGIGRLLPFDQRELINASIPIGTVEEAIFHGGYPEHISNRVPAKFFFDNYLYSYVQRDVVDLISPGNLLVFQRFLGILAGYAGQLLNYSSLATAIGVSVNTVKNWISILDQSYVIFLLPPYYKSKTRRLIKSPKLYFYDTGLLCYLLQMKSTQELRQFYMFGSLFENYVVADAIKSTFHNGTRPDFHFFRDSNGNEIDLVYDTPGQQIVWEIKATETYQPRLTSSLRKISSAVFPNANMQLIYGGREAMTLDNVNLKPWNQLDWSSLK